MSNTETQAESEKEPYEKCVKIKHNQSWYVIPEHEFTTYWLPNVPKVSKLAGLKRGKYYGRYLTEMNRKGTGKNEKDFT